MLLWIYTGLAVAGSIFEDGPCVPLTTWDSTCPVVREGQSTPPAGRAASYEARRERVLAALDTEAGLVLARAEADGLLCAAWAPLADQGDLVPIPEDPERLAMLVEAADLYLVSLERSPTDDAAWGLAWTRILLATPARISWTASKELGAFAQDWPDSPWVADTWIWIGDLERLTGDSC